MSDTDAPVYDPTLWAKCPHEVIIPTDSTGGGIRVLDGTPVALGHLSAAGVIDAERPETWLPLLCDAPTRPEPARQGPKYDGFGFTYVIAEGH